MGTVCLAIRTKIRFRSYFNKPISQSVFMNATIATPQSVDSLSYHLTNKQVDNSSYRTTLKIGAPVIVQIAWYFTNIIFFKNPFNILSSIKVALLRAFGAEIGKGVVIKPAVNIKYPWK